MHSVLLGRPALIGLCVLAASTVFLLVNEYQQQKERLLQSLSNSFTERFSGLNRDVSETAAQVERIRVWAESYLQNAACHDTGTFDPTRIAHRPGGDYFELLDSSDPHDAATKGNVFGPGRPADLSPAFQRKLHLALHLLDVQRAMLHSSRQTLRNYFVGVEGITSTYPPLEYETLRARAAPGGSFDQVLSSFYVPHAGRHLNPERQAYWTAPYIDRGGRGPMVTYAAPLYDADQYAGLICADITLDFLLKHIERCVGPRGRWLIADEKGHVLADSAYPSRGATNAFTLLADAMPSHLKDHAMSFLAQPEFLEPRLRHHYVCSRRLDRAPWALIHVVNRRSLSGYLRLSLAALSIATLVLTTFGLVSYLILRRRKAEEDLQATDLQLQRERDLLARIMDTGPIGIALLDPEGRVRFANNHLCRIFGVEKDIVVGRPYDDASWGISDSEGHPFPSDRLPFATVRETGQPVFDVRLAIRNSAGQRVLLSANAAPISGANGQLDSVVVIINDITERIRAEQNLRASESKFRAVFEEAAIGIVRADTSGRLLDWNPAFERFLGYTHDEIAALKNITELTCPDDIERELRLVRQVLSQGHDVCSLEKRYVSRDGRLLWGHVTISAIRDKDGRPEYVIGMILDITQQRALEDQLRQAQKMEAIGLLAGGVAHDFNNLLSPIMGYSDIALATLAKDNAIRAYFENILSAAQRAADLTRRLLAFGRKQPLALEIVNINDLLAGFFKLIQPTIGENIRVRIQTDPSLGFINADSSQIEQLLMNLTLNARDAMPDGGVLTIQTANRELQADYVQTHPEVRPGPYVMIQVSDTGCGMDAKTRERAFDPFFTTKQPGKGTGLGLSMVFGIVKQHGGYIDVYTVPRKGTTFTVLLPRIQPGPQAIEPTARDHGEAPSKDGRGESILIVEDEPLVLQLARDMLISAGYVVMTAPGPREALALARDPAVRIDLLLTDVIMPGQNGKDLYLAMTALRPGMKVLYMSGYTADVMATEGALEPGTHFMQKPLTADRLTAKVRSVLDDAR